MSTILKALRRLEEDRSSQARRPLREEVASGGSTASPRRRARWLGLALLALLVGGGAGALAFWSATRDAGPSELSTAAEPAAPPTHAQRAARLAADRAEARRQAAERRAEATARTAQAPGGLPAEAFESPVERLERPPAPPRIPPPDEETATPLAARRPTPPRPDAAQLPGRHRREELVPAAVPEPAETTVARAPTPAPAVEPTPVPPAPAPAPEPAPSAASPPAPAPARAEPEPAFESDGLESFDEETAILSEPELEPAPPPAVARAGIPGVHVQRTSWHPLEERRSAVVEVDGGVVEVREGDAVGQWVVTTIEPSGVVLLRNGVEVRRRVGER
jgi:hypothetical protein